MATVAGLSAAFTALSTRIGQEVAARVKTDMSNADPAAVATKADAGHVVGYVTQAMYDALDRRIAALDGGNPGTPPPPVGGGGTPPGGGGGGTTDPILALLPAGYVHRWGDDFTVLNLNLDTTQTDDGIKADKGVWGFCNLHYISVGKPGLPGFGMDYFLNPLAPSCPASSKRTDPLGQVDFSVAGELTMRCRPATSDELTAIHTDVAAVNGQTSPWVSPLLSARNFIAPKPPFAKLTVYKATPVANGQWGAPDWNLRQRNIGEVLTEFEIDSVENFPGDSHHYATLHMPSVAVGIGNYLPVVDATAVYLKALTICEANGLVTVKFLDMSNVVLATISKLITDPVDLATYLAAGHHPIINMAAGSSWGNAQSGTGAEFHQTVKSVHYYMPDTNLTLTPPVDPPTDTVITWRAGFTGGVIPDNTDPGSTGVIVADFNGAGSSFAFLGGDGKLVVSGSTLKLMTPVSHASVAAYPAYYGGRFAGSGIGLRPKITITVTSSGGVPWDDARAKVALNPPIAAAFALGVTKPITDYLSGLQATNTLKPFLMGRATSATITVMGHGGDANPYGLLGSDLHNGDLRFALEWVGTSTGANIIFKSGGIDHSLAIPGMTSPADPWAVTLSFGTDGISLWANGSDQITATDVWPTDGTNADAVGVGTNGFLDPGQAFPHLDRVFVYDQSAITVGAVTGTNGLKLPNALGKSLAVHL